MRAIAPSQTGASGAVKAPLPSPRAIEKTSATSALGREKREPGHQREKAHTPLRVELVSRDDTPRFDAFRDGPRLVPAFVAQVLGQVMPGRRETVTVEAAYGRAASPRTPLLMDRKS